MDTKKIIVALDGMRLEQSLTLAWMVSSKVWGFKVNDLLLEHGSKIIKELRCLGPVFADCKLYDIPKTAGNCVDRLSRLGADMISVHVSGGTDMLRTAVDNKHNGKIIGVTVLSSMTPSSCWQTYRRPIEETVWDMATTAVECNLDGLVCSSHELSIVKSIPLLKVVPGFVKESDYYVIGRPLTLSPDPIRFLEELEVLN